MEIGYFLSSEEHSPNELLAQAQLAEDVGLSAVWISDHFHPWLDEQGHSPFVWSVIGGIAATTRLRVSTAVTCPTMRIHPAIVGQAAATCALMLDGRFELGVGTGENLNEHILGDHWPLADERLEMLEEAIELMRKLWTGEEIIHRGKHYTVENARLYSIPDEPVTITMSAYGPKAADLAARVADGFVTTKPDAETLKRYRDGGGEGLASGGLKICWGGDERRCAELVHKLWRSSGVPGELSQDLRTPALFEQAASLVTVDSTMESTPCGPDLGKIAAAIREYADAGFDRLFINQIGPNQADFFTMYARELAPILEGMGITARPALMNRSAQTMGAVLLVVAFVVGLGALVWLLAATARSIHNERTHKRGLAREFGLTFALITLFFASWVAQAITQWQEYTDEAKTHNESVAFGDFLASFGQATFENWQSEFLQLFAFVSLSAIYIHKGSGESKDGTEKLEASLRRIEEHLGTLPPTAPMGHSEAWKLPDTSLDMQ